MKKVVVDLTEPLPLNLLAIFTSPNVSLTFLSRGVCPAPNVSESALRENLQYMCYLVKFTESQYPI